MKKKLALIILSVITAICCAVGLAACGEKEHTHTYATEWTSDATYHWHAATCEHTDEVSGKAAHTFENDFCTICGYNNDTDNTGGNEQGGTDENNTLAAGLYDADNKLLATYEESGLDVTIDYTYDNYKTTETSAYYVMGNKYPTAVNVVLPDSVTKIGDCAFSSCTNLMSVNHKNRQRINLIKAAIQCEI